jgi:hypothetical protein
MLAIIQSRIFCLPVSYQKIWRSKHTKLYFCQLCCMGAKLGLSLWGRNIDWGFLRTEYWGRYLALERMKTSWRKLHNDELHSLYSSPNIVRVIKSRRTRWAGHVSRMEEEVFTKFWLGGPKGKAHSVDVGVDGRITLRWTLRGYELNSAGWG